MEDQSINNATSNGNAENGMPKGRFTASEREYINDCVKEVCIKGESLSKYQGLIEKKFDADFFEKCNSFVEEIKNLEGKKKITNTSITKLKYLANDVYVTEETVDFVVDYYKNKKSAFTRFFIGFFKLIVGWCLFLLFGLAWFGTYLVAPKSTPKFKDKMRSVIDFYN